MKLENLFRAWLGSYYLDPLSALTAMIGFAIFIFKKDKKNVAFIFVYYFIAYVLLKSIFFVQASFPTNRKWANASELADYIFTLFEFLIFFTFFKKALFFNSHKKFLTVICYVFMFTGCAILLHDMFVSGKIRNSSANLLFNIQAIGLLIPSIFYYLEIFESKPILNLLNDSTFWVVTGLSFFMISTLPFSLLLNSFRKSNPSVFFKLFTLFYFFYIILFSMIIRAYLCKPETTK
jgi:hypothetical protein